MRRIIRRAVALLGCLLLGITGPAVPAAGQPAFPDRPIRIIVPVPPGGVGDQVARHVAQSMQTEFGQPVVVENRPGASLMLGTQFVARSAPDGHTLLLSTLSNIVLNGLLRSSMPYDAERDLTMLSILMETPFVLVVNPRVPATNLREFIAEARRTGQMTYSSSGVGTANHLPGEMLSLMSGVEFTHVAYGGGAPALTAVLSGDVTAVFDTVPTALPFLADGRLRAIGVSTSRRVSSLPEMPTLAEAGLPGFDSNTWIGIAAPAGLPVAVSDRLRRSLNGIITEGSLRARFEPQGMLIQAPMTAEQTARYLANEREKWGRVIRERRISLD